MLMAVWCGENIDTVHSAKIILKCTKSFFIEVNIDKPKYIVCHELRFAIHVTLGNSLLENISDFK